MSYGNYNRNIQSIAKDICWLWQETMSRPITMCNLPIPIHSLDVCVYECMYVWSLFEEYRLSFSSSLRSEAVKYPGYSIVPLLFLSSQSLGLLYPKVFPLRSFLERFSLFLSLLLSVSPQYENLYGSGHRRDEWGTQRMRRYPETWGGHAISLRLGPISMRVPFRESPFPSSRV